MAQATGSQSAYDHRVGTGGNREDLSDMVWDVSPADTPFISAIGKNKAKGVVHNWLTDSLTTGAGTYVVEGNEGTPAAVSARTNLMNTTGIFQKYATVTGTQESVDKAGVKNEMAYQIPRRMAEIKTNIESACVGTDNAYVTGWNDTTAREIASLSAYCGNGTAGDEFAAATSAAATGDGSDVPTKTGTDRALTEDIFKACLENLYTVSGGSGNIIAFCPPSQKSKISTFTASSSRYVTTDDKKLVASIDVYDGDFHTVKVVPDRFVQAGSIFLVDPKYVKLAELRPMFSEDIATAGDAKRKQVVWEGTLEVCSPDAHSHIFDLT